MNNLIEFINYLMIQTHKIMGLLFFGSFLPPICHINNKQQKGVFFMKDKNSYEYKSIHLLMKPEMADYVNQRAQEHGLTKNGFVRMVLGQYMANDKVWLELNR